MVQCADCGIAVDVEKDVHLVVPEKKQVFCSSCALDAAESSLKMRRAYAMQP